MKRRLTTILAADLAGYSRLMASDEEGVIQRLSEVRQEVIDPAMDAGGGRLFKTMGDGFLFEFTSPVNAVRSALAMQRGILAQQQDVPTQSQLQFRVGINLGDVVIDGDDVLGDGVNIAARLETLAPVGGVCISRAVYDQIKGRVDALISPMGPQHLKNIPEPIDVWQVGADVLLSANQKELTQTEPIRRTLTRWHVIVATIILLLVVIGYRAWFSWHGTSHSSVALSGSNNFSLNRPAIAVIPFSNQSGQPDQEYFSDGLTEDIITDLSRISGLHVIARQSSFAYKGEDIDIRALGRELQASYVLQGSVRRSNDRVRVSASLVDIERGTNIWADRYDHTVTDVFELQDEITRTIVSALAVSLTSEEERYLESTRAVNQDAYEILLRGLEPLRQFTAEGNLLARQYFEQAIEFDPGYARAHANLALTYARETVFSYGEHKKESIRQAIKYADKAESLDNRLTQTQFARGVVFQAQRNHVAAVSASRKAVELDPNYADGHVLLANTLMGSGVFDEARVALDKAMSLNPRYPFSYLGIDGQYYFLTQLFEQAATKFEQSLERNPGFWFGRMYLVASYGHLGRSEDAAWELEELLVIRPDFNLNIARKESLYKRTEDTQLLVDGLRLAGLQ